MGFKYEYIREKTYINGMWEYNLIKTVANNDAKKMGEIFRVISEDKPIAVVYGNCQSRFIAAILKNTDVINDAYNIVLFPGIHTMKSEVKTGFSKEYMQYISLFIYQNVTKENKFSPLFATDEQVLPLLGDNVTKCAVPYVYFTGYVPSFFHNGRNVKINNIDQIPYGDKQIATLIENGLSDEEIERKLESVELFSEAFLLDNVRKSIEELQAREEKCNVKISDYILDNYRKKYLFYSPTHPTTECLIELVKRIYQYIGIEKYSISNKGLPENDMFETYIYNSVKQKLGLEFECEKFRFNGYYDREKDKLLRYIKKYREYGYPEFKQNVICDFRSLDVSDMLKIDNEIVTERAPKKLMLCGRTLSMYLYINYMGKNGVIATIPEIYAPKIGFICSMQVVGKGGVWPVTINPQGQIILNSQEKDNCIGIINIWWNMK